MRKAIFRARDTEEFGIQQRFDRAVAALVGAIPIPRDVAEWFTSEEIATPRKSTWKNAVRNPVFAAIALALAVIAGVGVFQIVEHWHDFPGIKAAKRMLLVAGSTRSVLLDPVSADAGTLSDLFFMKFQLDHYDVPPEFANLRTIGYRVFDDEDGRRVGQVWVTEKKMQFFLFPAERNPKTGAVRSFPGWRSLEHEGWAGVVREQNGVCFMAALRGRAKELAPYLAAAKH